MQGLEKNLTQKIVEATTAMNKKFVYSLAQFQALTAAVLEIQRTLQGQHVNHANNSSNKQPNEEGNAL